MYTISAAKDAISPRISNGQTPERRVQAVPKTRNENILT
jgi:hypothetical protein